MLPPVLLEVPLQVLAPFSRLHQRHRCLSPVSHQSSLHSASASSTEQPLPSIRLITATWCQYLHHRGSIHQLPACSRYRCQIFQHSTLNELISACCLLSLPTSFACGHAATWRSRAPARQREVAFPPTHVGVPRQKKQPAVPSVSAGSSVLCARPHLTARLLLPGPAHLFSRVTSSARPSLLPLPLQKLLLEALAFTTPLPVFCELLTARKKLRRPTLPTCFPVHPRHPSSPSAVRGTANTYQRPADA